MSGSSIKTEVPHTSGDCKSFTIHMAEVSRVRPIPGPQWLDRARKGSRLKAFIVPRGRTGLEALAGF